MRPNDNVGQNGTVGSMGPSGKLGRCGKNVTVVRNEAAGRKWDSAVK